MNIGEDWMVTIESDDDIDDIAGLILDTHESMDAKVTQTPFNDEGDGQIAGGNAGYGIIITHNTDPDKNVSSIAYHVKPQIER